MLLRIQQVSFFISRLASAAARASLHHAAVQQVLVIPPSLAYVRAVETLRVTAVQRHHAADDVERGGDDGGVLVGEEREDGGEHAGGNQILCVRERTDRPSRARAL